MPLPNSFCYSASTCSLFLLLCYVSFATALFGFREAEERVRSEISKGRPCNFLLDFNDRHLLTPGIIGKYGYPVERHWVTTEDGYILELHRIPANKSSVEKGTVSGSGKSRPAVLLMHGVTGSSRDFVINCDRRALAFKLYDAGYDVWLGNYRGNAYCLNHTSLNVKDKRFWDFSIDEVGYYDVPAMVDYILNTTELKSLSYVAHSMGNGVALIMLTARPEYNEKLNIWFAMSGAVTLKGTSSPFLKIFASFPRTTQWLLTTFNHGQFLPTWFEALMHRFVPLLCRGQGRSVNHHGICSIGYFFVDGYNPGQTPPESASVVLGELPSSTSVKFMVQWMQWILSGDFTMFDHGPIKNLNKYGTVTPKKYPIENERTPAIIFWGQNDWIVDPSDVKETQHIINKLKEGAPEAKIEYFKVGPSGWNHGDFVLGRDADIHVYAHILQTLDQIYNPHEQISGNDSNSTHQIHGI